MTHLQRYLGENSLCYVFIDYVVIYLFIYCFYLRLCCVLTNICCTSAAVAVAALPLLLLLLLLVVVRFMVFAKFVVVV